MPPIDADPSDKKDYDFDWGARRLADGESITTSTWTVPAGITKVSDTMTPLGAGLVTTVWLTGGTEDTEYRITNHVVTNQGREYDWSIVVNVQQL